MNWKAAGAVIGILLGATLAVMLWPASDPLMGAEAVAIMSPEEGLPQEAASQGILVRGLTLVVEERGITVVENPERADLLLEISDVRLDELELTFSEEGLRGRLSATCLATDLRTGEIHRLRLNVSLEDGILRAELVAKRPWQFWR